MPASSDQCQACGGPLEPTGPHVFQMPGIVIARLCIPCRQDFQRFMMIDNVELSASFERSIAALNKAKSGLPSASGLSEDVDVFQHHAEIEQAMIAVWDDFVKMKQAHGEEGNEV